MTRLSLFAVVLAPALALAGEGPLVALDAGHGGPKVGAVGPGGLLEKDLTAAVVARAAAALQSRGYRVLLVRPGDEDVDLRERVHRANQAGAEIFVSVHVNSVGPHRLRRRVRGVETYFLSADATDEAARRLAESENGGEAPVVAPLDPLASILLDLTVSAAHTDSARLARKVHRALVERSGFPDRGVRQAPFAVLNGAAMPAVLVELGFISHPVEGRALGTPAVQDALAEALADGVDAFRVVIARRGDARL